jgi:hypothetical protein
MWTVFNAQGKAIVNCNYNPDMEDLASRGEAAYFHEEEIDLWDAMLEDGIVKRKYLVTLSVAVSGDTAEITIACDKPDIGEIPLLVNGVKVMKPPGTFTITGEAGVEIFIDFERDLFRGELLEVVF